jgi:hypothetical protein
VYAGDFFPYGLFLSGISVILFSTLCRKMQMDQILGFIPKEDYVKYTYQAAIGSAAAGLIAAILGLAQVYFGFSGLSSVLGLIALVLMALGLFKYREAFSDFDLSHLTYLMTVFAGLFIVSVIIGAFFHSAVFGGVLGLLVNLASLALVFTGFNSWANEREITMSNLAEELQSAIRRE